MEQGVVFAAELGPGSRNVNHRVIKVGKDLQAHLVQCVNPHVLEQNWTSLALPGTLSSLSVAWSGEVLPPGVPCVDPGVSLLCFLGTSSWWGSPKWSQECCCHSLAAGQDLSCCLYIDCRQRNVAGIKQNHCESPSAVTLDEGHPSFRCGSSRDDPALVRGCNRAQDRLIRFVTKLSLGTGQVAESVGMCRDLRCASSRPRWVFRIPDLGTHNQMWVRWAW